MLSKELRAVVVSAKIFVVLVCVLLMLLVTWNNWRARATQLDEARSTTTNISRALAQHAEDTFKAADTALIGMSEKLEYDGREPAALRRLERFLALQVSELTQLHALFVIDKEGNWIVNSEKMVRANVNSKDRAYFIYHQTHANGLPHIDNPIQSRVTGEWIVTISRRLNKPDGSFDGVVMAAIKLNYFANFYDNFGIGDAGALLLASNDGNILFRRPLRNDSIGKSLENASIFRDYASKTSSGVARITSAQDGITRINSYRHLNRYPLFVAAALSEDEVLANWKSDAIMHGVGLLLLIAFLGYLGNRMIVQIQLRGQAENEAIEARVRVEHLNQMLQGLAMHDGLTGLANRRCFDDEIVKELRRASRDGEPLAIVMIDVDYFKKYNDTYGHVAGDDCLRRIAAAVKVAEQRPGDLVARYGGEEIVVMLPHCDKHSATLIASDILKNISDLRIAHSGNPPGVVTASAGVAVLTEVSSADTAESIVDMADKALYQAKSTGRNRVCTYFGGASSLALA
ncbi:diguanylate cyclase [Herbaspirillum sp. meg3]|jgi:diguanylate cyclase (GGDEF)-like protein|uniref:sensor domain-containing diguanylate cyclase n=1 Tax=Herbaspirillum sp. meg3 TaxID=2025949 RepID=UPI000B9884E1|nr:GGDEF domain-containing protein [Herbaspirillum sp. meg3]ASU38850.1 diguanylate cyclase [Herbaspirillum sp. meg3]